MIPIKALLLLQGVRYATGELSPGPEWKQWASPRKTWLSAPRGRGNGGLCMLQVQSTEDVVPDHVPAHVPAEVRDRPENKNYLNCLTAAAVVRTQHGMKAITQLSATDSVEVFELARVGEDNRISSQDLLGVAKGQVTGWATYDTNSTVAALEFTYSSSGSTLQVTKSHYLMVKGKDDGVVLKQAQQVVVGNYLAAVPAEGQAGVSWKKVLNSRAVTATGLYVPLVMSDAGPGDVLVLADGVLVPIYSQYGGLTPSQAHKVFAVWEAHWQKLLLKYPCLDAVPRHHKASVAVEMVRDFSVQHAGRLLEEELNPTLLICHVAGQGTFQKACPEFSQINVSNCDHK